MKAVTSIGYAGLLALALALPVRAADTESLWTREGATLRDLVATTRGEERAEVLWRLGLWERESAKRLVAAAEKEGDEADRPTLDAHLDAADRALAEAEALASNERRPAVLFELGDLRRARGQTEQARGPLEEIVERYPEDPIAVDAAVALGEDAYDAARLAEAMARYTFAKERGGDSFAAAYAAYKLAWCHFELEEFDRARALLTSVTKQRGDTRQLEALADDALKDVVLVYARDPDTPATDVERAVKSLAPGERWRFLLEQYGRFIAAAGRDEEATALLSRLEPGASPPQASSILITRLEIALRHRDLPTVTRVSSRLVDVLTRLPADAPTQAFAERMLRSVAITLHGEGRTTRRAPVLETALHAYAEYFRAFDHAEHAYELHHHAGELLASLERHAEAERHYTAAVVRDLARIAEKQPAGKWLESAARGAVFEAEAALPAVDDAAARKTTAADEAQIDRPPPEPQPLSEAEERLLAACDRYLRALPDGADHASVAYRRGLTLYRRDHLADAVAIFTHVATRFPGTEVAPYAARLSIDALTRLGRYDDVVTEARRFGEVVPLAKALDAELDEVIEGAELAAAARAAKHGQHEEAVVRYERFAQTHAKSTRLDRALFNAAASLAALNRTTDAIAWRDRLLTSLPKSPLAEKTRQNQFADLVRLGRFADAAPYALEKAEVAARKGGRKDAATALHDAIVLTEAGGRRDRADALRSRYLQKYPRGPEAFTHAVILAERLKGCSGRAKLYEKALRHAPDASAKAIAFDRIAREKIRCGEEGTGLWYAREAVKLASKVAADDAEALDAVADASLLLAMRERERYDRTRIRPPYEKTLPAKLSAMQKLEGTLADVVKRGRAAPAVCALVESGTALAALAKELTSAKAPAAFTEDQRVIFEEELATKAQPLVDRAKEALSEALAQARETAVDPACLAKARATLAELWPEKHGPRADAVLALAEAAEGPECSADDVLARAPDAPAAWLIAAKAELAASRPSAALLLLDRIPANDWNAAEALEVRARAYEALGKESLALAAWGRAARLGTRRAAPLRVLADRALAGSDPDGARQLLEMLRELVPDDVRVSVNLAVALRAVGETEAAEKAIRSVLAKEDVAAARQNLGLLLCGEAGRPAEGLPLLESALDGTKPTGKVAEALAACRALAKGAGR